MKSSQSLAESLLNEHSDYGCFVTPLTDMTTYQPMHDGIVRVASELKEKIDDYVRSCAKECASDRGSPVTDDEIRFGNRQVLKWVLTKKALISREDL